MAGPEVSVQEQMAAAEESAVHDRSQNMEHDKSKFGKTARLRREIRERQRENKDLGELLKAYRSDKDAYLLDMDRFNLDMEDAIKRREQTWMFLDGSSVSFTYDGLLSYMEEHLADDVDTESIAYARRTLDKYPSAISDMEKLGFSFVNENDIHRDNPERTKAIIENKAKKMKFLNEMIQSYNDGTYTPYYDREKVSKLLEDADYNISDELLSKGLTRSKNASDVGDLVDLAEEYGISPLEMKKWYEAADRFILKHAEDEKPISVDCTGLFQLSNMSSEIQAVTNVDGIHMDGFFEKLQAASDAEYDMRIAEENMYQASSYVDEMISTINEAKEKIDKNKTDAAKMREAMPTLRSSLQEMYDNEMDRYQNGYTQQPPIWYDITKRWAAGKTRHLNSRAAAKAQMREQKWAQKTGIQERGIKTDGSIADFFKSIVRECRRDLYASGVTDFSIISDTDRLLVALGMDKTQRAMDAAKFQVDNLKDKITDFTADKKEEFKKKHQKSKTDVANYTKSLQIVSKAENGIVAATDAKRDYDGYSNNPADIMADRNDHHENQIEVQARLLQENIDEKGYNTGKDEPDIDGPDMD